MLDRFWKENLISLVYPDRCFLCQHILTRALEPISAKAQYCQDCFEQVCEDLIQRCYTCGAVTNIKNPFGAKCRLCRDLRLNFERAVAVGDYRSMLQQSIVKMKRQYNDITAIQFGRLLAGLLEKFDIPDNLDMITAIPSHWSRKLQRKGFHGSALIAEGIHQQMGWPFVPNVLKQPRRTIKQGTLSIRQRFKNVKGAFQLNRMLNRIQRVQDMQILLVDDVMTSGATVSEASQVLLNAGASRVFVAVVARGARVS